MALAKSAAWQLAPRVQRWMPTSPERLVNQVLLAAGSMATKLVNGLVPAPIAVQVVPLGSGSAGEVAAAKLSRVAASSVLGSVGCGAMDRMSCSPPSSPFRLSNGRCALHAPLFSPAPLRVRYTPPSLAK